MCKECSLCLHADCYQALVVRVNLNPRVNPLPSLNWICGFCKAYTGRVIDKILGQRIAKPLSSNQNRSAKENLAAADIMVKWKDMSYRHVDWIPYTWLAATSKSIKLRMMRPSISSGVLQPYLINDTFNEEHTVVDSIIGMHACSPSIADQRATELKTKGLDATDKRWQLYTACKSVLVVWKGLDETNATWETPPCPADDLDDFVLWSAAYTRCLCAKKIEGVNWLWRNWLERNSCILADEMGLGKTIQIISFILTIFRSSLPDSLRGNEATMSNQGTFPFLVVVPSTLVDNWVGEFRKWAPELVVSRLTGVAEARKIQFERTIFPKSNNDLGCHVVVASYAAFNAPDVVKRLSKARSMWRSVIIDEGHRLKNSESKLYQTLLGFKTRQRVLITGTPLQNDLRELFNLMAFIGAKEFENAKRMDEKYKDPTTEDIAEIQNMIRPYFLRRIKDEVLAKLPPKREFLLPVTMSQLQRNLYRATLEKNVKLLRQIATALHSQDSPTPTHVAADGSAVATGAKAINGSSSSGHATRARSTISNEPPKIVGSISLHNLLME
ncbi:hypothetical protein FBU59_003153, partial [Linderina macrospora]